MKLFDRIRENKNRPDEEERLMFEMEQIGKRISRLRKSQNLTQQDLADQLVLPIRPSRTGNGVSPCLM